HKRWQLIQTFCGWGPGSRPFGPPAAPCNHRRGPPVAADRSNNRVDVFDKDGNFIAFWKQFGRPSGIAIDKDDMLYVIDSQSTDMPGDRYTPSCKRGIRVGSVKDGKVLYYIPPPPPADPTCQPAIGIAADR